MTEGIRFGVVALQNMPWEELVRLWQKFEALGFDSTWIADHFVNYANPTGPWLEGWTTLAALANCTSSIRIGTLVTSISLRNPALLARQAMTVDHISGGRLELGIGAGAPGGVDPSYRMIGIGDWSFQERTERLREQVEIVDKLLRNITSSYTGKYYKIDEVIMAPGPVQKPRPPIIVAAHAKASLKVAAEYADAWVSFGGEFGAPVEVVVEKTTRRNEILNKHCEKVGRDPASLRRSLLIFGAEGNTAFASEGQFIEIVERYSAIGINELIFFYPFFAPDQIPIFEQIAKETIPSLRKSHGPSGPS
ncbi:MAG: LLM class flavin-dependent oxidoreductase [Candidatus Thorarchaeota archaeon]|jgi:alkanesulfonate monooxygenase SsuD/methylene tetrahydromethanopterin reductase-like flavin-dependent oxidoreductase (luciferase family)